MGLENTKGSHKFLSVGGDMCWFYLISEPARENLPHQRKY
jgi:hypothetical protein